MSYRNLPIAERLAFAHRAIENARADAEVLALLSVVSYDEARLAEGRALYDRAAALHHRAQVERGGQYAATDALHAAREAAEAQYMAHLERARLVFKKERGVLNRLGAAGRRAQNADGWTAQVRRFYRVLLEEAALQERMAAHGVPLAALQAGAAAVEAIEAADLARTLESGAAQDATSAQNEALGELDAWMSTFIAFARQALADRPQLLEKLGIVARS